MQDRACSHDQAYLAIIITIIPLWAVITTLIVFALLLFQKHIRLTKIYDNCTKATANYVYHVEIRTGDTSATYNRRKATITIDMFDENQATLARIAIPGNVIFGRKDAPVTFLDDDKYFELRVTRLWLYRATKLRRVSTIRITHTCMEPEARIMVYGLELRLDERDKPKLFFPVMNYITPYGTANKINACFDSDPIGSISNMGGTIEPTLVSDHLNIFDYSLLVYLFCGLVFFSSYFNIITDGHSKVPSAVIQGTIVGAFCSIAVILVGLFMRYVIKSYYSLYVGSGLGAVVYYIFDVLIVIAGLVLWIASTVLAYSYLCADKYKIWLLSLSVAAIEGCAWAILVLLVYWLITTCYPSASEQYALPDDTSMPIGQGSGQTTREPDMRQQPSALLMPMATQSGPSMLAGPPSPWGPSQTPVLGGVYGAVQAPMPMPMPMPLPLPPQQQQSGGMPYRNYANVGPGFDTTGHYQPPPQGHGHSKQRSPTTLAPRTHTGQQQTTGQGQSYHQQVTGAAPQQSGSRTKTKKTGSNESTGSTYYQQLMKNKGGVKSISQYGELMKQKKNKR